MKLERGCHIGAGTLIYPNVTIGRNAIIGANSTINANIGEGAEVKAHSLVLTDVPKGRTVFGVPAR